MEHLEKEEIQKLSNIDLLGQLIATAHTFGDFVKETEDLQEEILKRMGTFYAQDVKKIIHSALYELTAIDEKLRLDPLCIYNPFEVNEAINTAFKTTCNVFNIPFTKEDLKPEGKELVEQFIAFTKESKLEK